jgi:hypothetical protein
MIRSIVTFIVTAAVVCFGAGAHAAGEGDTKAAPGGPAGTTAPPAQGDKPPATSEVKPAPTPAQEHVALCNALQAEKIPARGCGPVAKQEAKPLRAPRSVQPTSVYSQPHAAVVPGVVGELASLLVEIAVDKAKRSGLEVVRAKVRDAVCELDDPRWGGRVLPATCQLIAQVSLERLASSPEAILVALTNDLVGHAARIKVQGVPANVRPLVELALAMSRSALARSPAAFAPSDGWALLGTALNSVETVNDPTVKASLRALRACARLLDSQPSASCDAVFMAQAAIDAAVEAKPELANVVELVALGQKVLGGSGDAKVQAVAARLRFRDAVEFIFTMAAKLSSATDLTKVRGVVLAALDGDVAILVSAGADLLLEWLPDQQHRSLQKVNLVVSTIGSYAETLSKTGGGDGAADEKEKLRAARKEILENLVEAATVRTDRHREGVWSIGMPVGFVSGKQWRREPSAPGDFGDGQWMAPQLELALGIAFQILPGKHWSDVGLHVMALALDLGQYASYDSSGTLTEARWDTLLAPGLQIGVALGTPSNVFVVGGELRYAPTLFSDNPGVGVATSGGAIRCGLFAAYHVSFFDFN